MEKILVPAASFGSIIQPTAASVTRPHETNNENTKREQRDINKQLIFDAQLVGRMNRSTGDHVRTCDR
jgi:hypothetical protein